MLELWNNADIPDGAQLRTLRARPLDRAALQWLEDTDRAILELAEQGVAHRVIGRAVNLNAGSVCRRLSQLRGRLASPVVRVLLSPKCPVPDTPRKIALLHLLTGFSIPKIARTLDYSDNAVREHVRYATGIVHGLLKRSTG